MYQSVIKRRLSLLEHESYTLLKAQGINVPRFDVIDKPDGKLSLSGDVVLKAQVLAGGRGMGKFIEGLDKGVIVANSKYQTFHDMFEETFQS